MFQVGDVVQIDSPISYYHQRYGVVREVMDDEHVLPLSIDVGETETHFDEWELKLIRKVEE